VGAVSLGCATTLDAQPAVMVEPGRLEWTLLASLVQPHPRGDAVPQTAAFGVGVAGGINAETDWSVRYQPWTGASGQVRRRFTDPDGSGPMFLAEGGGSFALDSAFSWAALFAGGRVGIPLGSRRVRDASHVLLGARLQLAAASVVCGSSTRCGSIVGMASASVGYAWRPAEHVWIVPEFSLSAPLPFQSPRNWSSVMTWGALAVSTMVLEFGLGVRFGGP